MFGISASLQGQSDLAKYSVRNNIVVQERGARPVDRFAPSAFILPSIVVAERSKFGVVSIIVPAGLSSNAKEVSDASLGFGVSFGKATSKGGDLGFGLALVWSNQQVLSPAHVQSFKSGSPLPAGSSSELGTTFGPSAVIGLYVVPPF